MATTIPRREVLAGAGALLMGGLLGGCGADRLRPAGMSRPMLELPPLRARPDRITRITVCTRPFRADGPRIEAERIGDKTVVHNYGHGGSGWSLSWGSGALAVELAMATGERDIAVIGCGAIGLTTATLLQRAGARVTIYAKDLPPNVRSSLATGTWTPDSRVCLQDRLTPAFKARWQSMTRRSFEAYQTLLGLPGTPVEFFDFYFVSDEPAAERPPPAADGRPRFAVLQRELVPELLPRMEEFAPGEHNLGARRLRRTSSLLFNLAAYSHLLLSDFVANGGSTRRATSRGCVSGRSCTRPATARVRCSPISPSCRCAASWHERRPSPASTSAVSTATSRSCRDGTDSCSSRSARTSTTATGTTARHPTAPRRSAR